MILASIKPAGRPQWCCAGCGISTFEAKKVIQECRPDLRSFDLFDLLRNFPKTVVESVPQAEGEAIKKRLEDAGCEIELG